jgi:hypothetical protein
MVEYFVVLAPAASSDEVRMWLADVGGRTLQAYGERALVVELPDDAPVDTADASGISGIFQGPVPDDIGDLDEVARIGAAAWNLRQSTEFQDSRQKRIGEGRSWGSEDVDREG